MQSENRRKYDQFEDTLHDINRKYISIQESDIERNNAILHEVLGVITDEMKSRDKLFNELFKNKRFFYGGSFYDGLKIKKPDEFDIDLLLKLPALTQPTISDYEPGYVHLELPGFESWARQPIAFGVQDQLRRLLQDAASSMHRLDTKKVRSWMQSVLHRALNEIGTTLVFRSGNKVELKFRQRGPAWTISIICDEFTIDVDLVAAFIVKDWPQWGKYRQNPTEHRYSEANIFFVVGKPIKEEISSSDDVERLQRCWRLSFQTQEREIINDKGKLKPVTKFLKKLKENFSDHKAIMCSYFIKNVVLWIQDEITDDGFWTNSSLSYVFMTVLKRYVTYIEYENVPYYWNPDRNLIEKHTGTVHLQNLKNYLRSMVNTIENNLDNPKILYTYFDSKATKQDSFSDATRTEVVRWQEEPETSESDTDDYHHNHPRNTLSMRNPYPSQEETIRNGVGTALGAAAITVGIGALALGVFALFSDRNRNRNN